MRWARASTLTESTWSTPVRATVRSRVRIVGVAWAGSRNPWAASATRRACARDRVVVTTGTQPRPTDTAPQPASGEVEQLLAHGVHDGLHAGVELQLLQDVADVVLDGVLADDQLAGDLAVVHPGRDVAQHLELALGQPQPGD